MVNPNRFYTYAYLREDRTPYYIGKGSGKRIYCNTGRPCRKPKDKSRIIFLKQNLTEEEAFKHEIYMIDVFGRKDLKTGILLNKTNGGDGSSGVIVSEETRKKLSEKTKGKNNPNYGKTHSKETKRKQSEARKGKSPSKESNKKRSETLKGKNNHNYGKTGEKNHNYGKKWWNDGRGNTQVSFECPGEDWVLGRGKTNKIKIGKTHHKSNYWKITFADGKTITQCGLSNWAKENGYDRSSIYRIYTGKYKKHKDIVALLKLS